MSRAPCTRSYTAAGSAPTPAPLAACTPSCCRRPPLQVSHRRGCGTLRFPSVRWEWGNRARHQPSPQSPAPEAPSAAASFPACGVLMACRALSVQLGGFRGGRLETQAGGQWDLTQERYRPKLPADAGSGFGSQSNARPRVSRSQQGRIRATGPFCGLSNFAMSPRGRARRSEPRSPLSAPPPLVPCRPPRTCQGAEERGAARTEAISATGRGLTSSLCEMEDRSCG